MDEVVALEALAEAVKFVNQAPPVTLNEERTPLVKRFSGLPSADLSLRTKGFGLKAAIAALNPASFEEILAALNKISDSELRGVAVVTLCRQSLKPPTRTAATKPA